MSNATLFIFILFYFSGGRGFLETTGHHPIGTQTPLANFCFFFCSYPKPQAAIIPVRFAQHNLGTTFVLSLLLLRIHPVLPFLLSRLDHHDRRGSGATSGASLGAVRGYICIYKDQETDKRWMAMAAHAFFPLLDWIGSLKQSSFGASTSHASRHFTYLRVRSAFLFRYPPGFLIIRILWMKVQHITSHTYIGCIQALGSPCKYMGWALLTELNIISSYCVFRGFTVHASACAYVLPTSKHRLQYYPETWQHHGALRKGAHWDVGVVPSTLTMFLAFSAKITGCSVFTVEPPFFLKHV